MIGDLLDELERLFFNLDVGRQSELQPEIKNVILILFACYIGFVVSEN